MPSTIRLHRVIAVKPDKLYRAFLEPDAVASWLPPYGFLCTVHELDAKVGGHHRMSFRNFTTGQSHSSAAPIWNSFRASASSTPIASTIPTCRAR